MFECALEFLKQLINLTPFIAVLVLVFNLIADLLFGHGVN